MDLISVIVPVYNVEQYLKICLDSIINQTYINLEIILVNDGSTDGSGDICEEYKRNDGRIKVIHKENGGLSSARNIGIRNATGNWIGFVDSDDYVEKDMYESLLLLAKKYKADLVLGQFRTFDSLDIEDYINTNSNIIFKEKELIETFILNPGKYRITNSVWDRLYKKELVENIDFPEGKLNEDIVYTIEVFYKCKKAVYVDHAYYNYRINRAESIMTKQYRPKNLYDLFALTEEASNFLYAQHRKDLADIYFIRKYISLYDALCEVKDKETKVIIKRYLNNKKKIVYKIIKGKNVDNKIRIMVLLGWFSPKIKKYIFIFYEKLKCALN